MHITGLGLSIAIGAIAGLVASRIKGQAAQKRDVALNMVVGIVGGFIGTYVSSLLGLYWSFPATLFLGFLGGVIALFLAGLVRRMANQSPKTSVQEPTSSYSPSVRSKMETPVPSTPAPSKPVSSPIKPQNGRGNVLKRFAGKSAPGVIFISYRRSDTDHVAGRIYDRLVGGFGKASVFKDVDSIPLGLDFKEYLDEKVGECDVLLAIIGEKWLEARDSTGKSRLEDPTDFVRIEIEAALERRIPVIPLLVGRATMPSAEELPVSLRKLIYRNGIAIRADPDFHRDMDRLITALKTYV